MFRLVCGMFQAAFCQCCTVLHRVFSSPTHIQPDICIHCEQVAFSFHWKIPCIFTSYFSVGVRHYSDCDLWCMSVFFQPFSHLCPGIVFCVFSFWSMQVILNLFWKCFTRLSFIFIALIYRFYYFSLTLNKLSYFFKWLQTIYFTYT